MTFTEYASSARQDVAEVLGTVEGSPASSSSSSWVKRLHSLSSLALELWPPEAPHWRVAGSMVIPSVQGNPAQYVKELSAALSASSSENPKAESQGLDHLGRASCLRAVSAFQGGAQTTQQVTSLMTALVGGSGVQKTGVKGMHLEEMLPLEELLSCISAVASSSSQAVIRTMKDSPLREFVLKGTRRLLAADELPWQNLLELHSALVLVGLNRNAVESKIRQRLLTAKSTGASTATPLHCVSDIVASAKLLGEDSTLRSGRVRQAMLSDGKQPLSPSIAAKMLQHAVPHDGAFSLAQEFVVARAVACICKGSGLLSPKELGQALNGILALQARGNDFAIRQVSLALRSMWAPMSQRLPHFGPRELSDALRAYSWQLQYSQQELALTGNSLEHPIVDVNDSATRLAKETKMKQAFEDFSQKLLRPVMGSLGQMPLRQVAACLTALAPPLRPPDLLEARDRAALNAAVQAAFSAGPSLGSDASEVPVVHRPSGLEGVAWWDDYWAGEVSAMSTVELLELACGLREAEIRGGWPLGALLAEIEERLQPSRVKTQEKPVELPQFLLLRLCRVVDLWHGHQVEQVLQLLLSDQKAMKVLPSSYFVAMLTALCEFPVPKELILRLTVSFLGSAELGERTVQPEQWADVLRTVRALDEVPSWERMTPRIVQRLIPHLGDLSAHSLASLLHALAARPLASQGEHCGPLEQLPGAACMAVRKAVEAGSWDFDQVVNVFDSMGRLGWYDEQMVAAIISQCASAPLLEPHAPLLLPIVRACALLRIHDAPLLRKVVLWYCWCYNYLWSKPLASESLDDLLELAENLSDLSFQSMDLHGVLAQNLKNPNASPRQMLGLLSALARFAHFPTEFKDACSRVCATSTNTELSSLSQKDLINAFNIHLCAVFDGPAALKHWLTTDETMKLFFQVHTSQKWYQKQDQERVAFLQSPAYSNMKSIIKAGGLGLVESEPGEVYHVEFVSKDAKDRLTSNDPPTALVCIKTKEQLRWYVPIMAETMQQGGEMQNRCRHFRYMFHGSVQKMRHLQAMGYRTAVIWMSEWNSLETKEERLAYMQAATGTQGRRTAAFKPSSAEEEDAYR